MSKKGSPKKLIAQNKRARFEFSIEETFEAGIMLVGSEVKSLREGRCTLTESYATNEGGDIVLINAYIPEYAGSNKFNHETKRPRKLLLHKREINKILGAIQKKGKTVVPLSIYFNDKGYVKVELGLAAGKKLHDKRETEKQRDWSREKARVLKEHS